MRILHLLDYSHIQFDKNFHLEYEEQTFQMYGHDKLGIYYTGRNRKSTDPIITNESVGPKRMMNLLFNQVQYNELQIHVYMYIFVGPFDCTRLY